MGPSPTFHRPPAGDVGGGGRPVPRRHSPRTIGTTGKLWLACSVLLIAWMVVTVHSAWARRVTDRVDAAISRAFARARTGWLTGILRTVRPSGDGLDVVDRGDRPSRFDDRVPPLAPPVHVPGKRLRLPGHRSPADRDVREAPALRRHPDRTLGGLLAALGDGCHRELHDRRRDLRRRGPRPAANDRQDRRLRVSSLCCCARPPLPRHRPSLRRSSPPWPSASSSHCWRSASSRRTSSSRSPIAGARRPTST